MFRCEEGNLEGRSVRKVLYGRIVGRGEGCRRKEVRICDSVGGRGGILEMEVGEGVR